MLESHVKTRTIWGRVLEHDMQPICKCLLLSWIDSHNGLHYRQPTHTKRFNYLGIKHAHSKMDFDQKMLIRKICFRLKLCFRANFWDASHFFVLFFRHSSFRNSKLTFSESLEWPKRFLFFNQLRFRWKYGLISFWIPIDTEIWQIVKGKNLISKRRIFF